ncbi:hypothetical protein JSY36_08285 [Bacillus sp. H-16]|uniref:zinc ribbon domain-containing protein n=1 Tax=Alteribacter salitolerans TaxID=2912333 RepID=UPI0019667619|nr:hypothetical protein [Alteribacter salitolerans]MBM7095749.1 hypothetical protein [Alteribacter salitolerans]
MEYCTVCGVKQEEQSSFCTACGAKKESNNQTGNPAPAAVPKSTGFSQVSKRSKIIAASLIGLALLFTGFYQVGASMNDPMKNARSFVEALENNDAQYISKRLVSSDESLHVDEKNIEGLLSFFEDNYYEKEFFYTYLNDQMEHINTIEETTNFAVADSGYLPGHSFLTYEKTGRSFLFFDRYEFVLHPVPLTVHSNHHDLTLYIDGEEFENPEYGDGVYYLGSLLPGYYDIAGKLDTDLVQLETEVSTAHFYDGYIDLYLEMEEIDVYFPFEGASLYINGKDTGKVMNGNDDTYGPVLLDGSMDMHLEKESPFGTLVTPPVTLMNHYYELSLALNDEYHEPVIDSLHTYMMERSKGEMTLDAATLSAVTTSHQGEFNNVIQDVRNYGGSSMAFLTGTVFDLQSFDLTFYEGDWYVHVEVEEA